MYSYQLTLCTCFAALGASFASADDSFSAYGFDFVRITDPGNRDTNDEELPHAPGIRIGGVNYEFCIADKELTIEQHLEFVIAYYPFYVKETGQTIAFSDMRGPGIDASFGSVAVIPGFDLQEPSSMSWEYAARYLNWLHHGKVVEQWAFQTGVYDVSTFYDDINGDAQHQLDPSPGARYRFPSLDEWTKAAHWDPAKNDGAGGYWLYPNGSDIEPLPGFPHEGGERNAGDDDAFPLPVCSYPDVQSPWGLYDVSGGENEWTGTARRDRFRDVRINCGSVYSQSAYGDMYSDDLLGFCSEYNAAFGAGLRLATSFFHHPADLNEDGRVNFFDVSQFIRWFIDGDDRADFRKDDMHDVDDVRVFLGLAEMTN